jgi:hypothetical protein
MRIWHCETIAPDVPLVAGPMGRRQLFIASSADLLVAGFIYVCLFRQSAYERAFDESLAHFPLAASMAHRDPDLRDIFLRKTEAAFNRGGWPAANRALRISLATDVEIFADDEHINAISRSFLAVLLKLQDRPAACKSFLFAGAETDEFPDAKQEIEQGWLAHLAAIENGFDRKMSGVTRVKPDDNQLFNVAQSLRLGPIAMLTQAEFEVEAEYPGGDAGLICSAGIKKHRNLAALSSRDAAYAERVLMSNTGNIDIADVLAKLCRENSQGAACS